MYLLNLSDESGEFSVVGSSPEALVTISASAVTMHPIAGSRPRGKNTDEDNALAEGLIEDAKETAEHLMLVDLARNDLLKVCTPASVEVSEFMQIRRFSHIMHLVSTVEGILSANSSVVDVFRATFPAGTLSGAPKPKALEIIERLEPTSRGIFGGVVGYFDFAGNADLAIAIRTAFVRDSMAHVQAGAGIVLDSDPNSEFEETVNKARATLAAISAANEMRVINE
jgi:anthranilate synthase component 1